MIDNRPIGVFDSGVGGLTAVKELHKIMPQENIIYFGDTGRVPYGTRSSQTIKRYSAEIIRYLATFNVKAILAACNTVSANFSIEDYQELGIDIPYLTVIEPAANRAVEATKNNKVGVMATTSSINSGAYTKAIKALSSKIEVISQACPLLIPLTENGMTQRDNQITNLTIAMYLEPLKKAGVDTVVLGCTHFPLVADNIQDALGDKVTLIDSGASAVQELKKKIVPAKEQQGETFYYVTDTIEHFSTTAEMFLHEDISQNITYVDLETIDKKKKNEE